MLNLDRIALDQAAACTEIQRAASVCAVVMDTTGLNIHTGETEGGVTELDEHVELMDRVLVFREHELFRELDRGELSREALVSAFFGEGGED